MSIGAQQFIGGPTDGATVDIHTDGRLVRPLFALPNAMMDECRVRFTPDGISIRHKDPANVALLDVEVAPAAFDEYDVDGAELVTGINLETLTGNLRDARMGKSSADDVRLSIGGNTTGIEIRREYGDTSVVRTDEFLNIDPDSVRERPDAPNLDLPWSATVDVDAFADAVEHIGSSYDHAEVAEAGGDLRLSGSSKDNGEIVQASAVSFEGVAEQADGGENDGAASLFTMDYLIDVARAVKKAKADRVEIRWSEEFPARFTFERTGGETTLYSGEFMLAPRITGDSK